MTPELIARISARYASTSRWDHFHARQRLRLCPYDRLLPHLPAAGRLLDLGCGAGLFGQFLAETRPELAYFGADVDPRKVAIAERAFAHGGHSQARVFAGDVRAWSDRPRRFEVIVALDVFYLLPEGLQKEFFDHCCQSLADDGDAVFLLKILPPFRGLAQLRTWVQETLMVRVLRKTMSSGVVLSSQDPDLYAQWGRAFGLTCEVHPLDTTPQSLLLVLARPHD